MRTIPSMPLVTPSFLDLETLKALAEYHDIEVPRKEDIVAKSTNRGSAEGRAGVSGIRLGGSLGKDLEFQSSYSLTPSEKAIVSRIIDGLIREEHAVKAVRGTPLSKDLLLEIEGRGRITSASLAGKIFHMMLRVLKGTEQSIDELDTDALTPDLMKEVQAVYFSNELLPIPILVELERSPLESKVFLNLDPHHFVDAVAADRTEGELRALATVANLVPEGEFISTERWLLSGWEFMLRRIFMAHADEAVVTMLDGFDIDLEAADVHAWIEGPAVVLNVIALY